MGALLLRIEANIRIGGLDLETQHAEIGQARELGKNVNVTAAYILLAIRNHCQAWKNGLR